MKLTILMYHKIDEEPAGTRHPGNYVAPHQFAEQMDALLAWGYETITLEQWRAYRDGNARVPARPLILTFDDGYACFARNAWPVLRARGMLATVFLVAGQIGGTNAWDDERDALLDARTITRLHAEGVRFGSHTQTHVPLARVSVERALDELTRSRAGLCELLGFDVDALAYPYSNQNAVIRGLARRAGYRCAVRGKGRMNWRHTDLFGLRRIKVEPDTSVERLARTLLRERWFRVF